MIDTWAQFRTETFGDPYMVWHEGPDFERLARRWEAEPQVVLLALNAGIGNHDPVAAQAIEFLARHGAALTAFTEALRSALPAASDAFQLRSAQALLALSGDQGPIAIICEVLVSAPSQFDRLDAAIALSTCGPTPDVISALTRGGQDPEYLVRRHSAQSLLTLSGRAATIEDQTQVWALIKSSTPRRWRKAADELARPWST